MNIMVIGSGGREHTLAWKINQSNLCNKLYVVPGNAGTAEIAENVDISISDFDAIGNFAVDKNVNLIVVGPEAPLVDGIRDYFLENNNLKHISLIGPDKKGAQLEGSKDFAKEFMKKYNIPTAASKTFTSATIDSARDYINSSSLPIVLKADGLAAGKGVIICQTKDEALKTIEDMLLGEMFGTASLKVVIEDFLDGIEVSIFVLTDGNGYVIFPEAKDYKRIGENDSGPNTGGMGSVSPVSFANEDFIRKVDERIIKPTISGLQSEGIEYNGFIFLGLMNINNDPYIIEYNVRMGDPESQVVIPRIENDMVKLLNAVAKGTLQSESVQISEKTAVTIVLASEGYPGNYEKGKLISGLENSGTTTSFHAGTKFDENQNILTNGGRVLAVTGMGDSLVGAMESAYKGVGKISWKGMQYRKDIGQDLKKLEK